MFAFLTSSIGKKYIMAVTGILLVLFTLGHMVGNLQIYLKPEAINKYAHTLQSLGGLLWLIRGGLLFLFVVHVITGITLYLGNQGARPIDYVKPATIKATLPSRTMIITGLSLFAFIVYHIMHFTLHLTDPSFSFLATPEGHMDVHRMLVTGFGNMLASAVYIAAMIALGMHLYHGATSWFQTLGINNVKYNCTIKIIGPVIAVIVFLFNTSIPVSVLTKFIK
ncbi:MAG: succinate dehydrogenase cytochrome b subunit [Deltaproteobacteria bacterium]|nr:succinate dehydrogenase cytochrome b subunit [Deltaproteobacteria bacterium]